MNENVKVIKTYKNTTGIQFNKSVLLHVPFLNIMNSFVKILMPLIEKAEGDFS